MNQSSHGTALQIYARAFFLVAIGIWIPGFTLATTEWIGRNPQCWTHLALAGAAGFWGGVGGIYNRFKQSPADPN
jgi:hypothetical protein